MSQSHQTAQKSSPPNPSRHDAPGKFKRRHTLTAVEKAVVSLFLDDEAPHLDLFAGELAPQDFTDPGFRGLFEILATRSAEGEATDFVSVRAELAEMENPPFPPEEVFNLVGENRPSAAMLPDWVNQLKKATQARDRERAVEVAQASLADGDIGKAIELLREAEEAEGIDGTERLLESCKYDPDAKPEKPAAILTLRGIPILSPGGLATVQGAEKSGKSHVAESAAGAGLGLGASLGIGSETEGGAVAYIDCEQSAFDFWNLANRAGNDRENFHAFHATGMEPRKIRKLIAAIIKTIPDLKLLLIDGYADLVLDVNDAEESNELVAWLMRTAEENKIGICGIVHLNPGSEAKTRGHLGSQLTRKCETTVQIDCETGGEVRIMYTAKARHRPLPKSQGIRFEWSDDAKGFVEIEGTPEEIRKAEKLEEWTRTLKDVQAETSATGWKHSELAGAISKVEGVTTRTAKTRIRQLLNADLLRHDGARGNYYSELPSEIDENHNESPAQAGYSREVKR